MIEADIPDSPTSVISNLDADTDAPIVEPASVPLPLCVSKIVPTIFVPETEPLLTIPIGFVCV